MKITVSKTFNTSVGFITILIFPEGKHPKVGMEIKKSDKTYVVKGISFNQSKEKESLQSNSYACILNVEGNEITAGDILEGYDG